MVQVDTVGGRGNCAADRPLNLDLVNIKLDLQSIYLEDTIVVPILYVLL